MNLTKLIHINNCSIHEFHECKTFSLVDQTMSEREAGCVSVTVSIYSLCCDKDISLQLTSGSGVSKWKELFKTSEGFLEAVITHFF